MTATEINAHGLNMTGTQMTLLRKVEELTLYTLEQDEITRRQAVNLATQQAELTRLRALEERMARIEAALAAQ